MRLIGFEGERDRGSLIHLRRNGARVPQSALPDPTPASTPVSTDPRVHAESTRPRAVAVTTCLAIGDAVRAFIASELQPTRGPTPSRRRLNVETPLSGDIFRASCRILLGEQQRQVLSARCTAVVISEALMVCGCDDRPPIVRPRPDEVIVALHVWPTAPLANLTKDRMVAAPDSLGPTVVVGPSLARAAVARPADATLACEVRVGTARVVGQKQAYPVDLTIGARAGTTPAANVWLIRHDDVPVVRASDGDSPGVAFARSHNWWRTGRWRGRRARRRRRQGRAPRR